MNCTFYAHLVWGSHLLQKRLLFLLSPSFSCDSIDKLKTNISLPYFSCDSIDKLKTKLPNLEKEVSNDAAKFKDFYQFTFNYAKGANQKSLDLDMAVAYWNIVLRGRFKFLDIWCTFLKVNFAVLVY